VNVVCKGERYLMGGGGFVKDEQDSQRVNAG